MMIDPAQVLKGIEEDPSLLEELAALGGDGGGEDAEFNGKRMGECVGFSLLPSFPLYSCINVYVYSPPCLGNSLFSSSSSSFLYHLACESAR